MEKEIHIYKQPPLPGYEGLVDPRFSNLTLKELVCLTKWKQKYQEQPAEITSQEHSLISRAWFETF
jgi:hypothetical protein